MKRILIAIAALFLFVACGPLKYQVKGTQIVTGADAEVIADIQPDQRFTRVQVNAINLPPPVRVKEGGTNFVVWQRKDDTTQWTRVGGLTYDEGSRKGSLVEVTVPELAFDLQITVETTPDPAAPSPDIIFAQRVQKK